MRTLPFFVFPLLFIATGVKAFDSTLLQNNKEQKSRKLSPKDMIKFLKWPESRGMRSGDALEKGHSVIKIAMNEFDTRTSLCDLGLVDLLEKKAQNAGLINNNSDFLPFISYLRASNIIDDLLYTNLKDSNALRNEFKLVRPSSTNVASPSSPEGLRKSYASFNPWPNEIDGCSIDQYQKLVNELSWKDAKDRDNKLSSQNSHALKLGIISQEAFDKLNILRTRKVLAWHTNIKGYLDIVSNAKDKLTTSREQTTSSSFSVEYVSKKQKLTQRGRLYKLYDSTQVMMLADLIDKTAKRMDAKKVSLNFVFTDNQSENYIFSPMEQYRISINLLKKEMAETMRSENFKGISIQYEDLISAAFETGMIKSEELDYVLRFEDFWNPKTPKWRKYANFAFSLAGTASFYVPAPWNVMATIGLVLTQTKLMNKKKANDPEDNWNTII